MRSLRLLWMGNAASSHTERWIAALASRGHRVTLYSFTDPVGDFLSRLPGVDVESGGVSAGVAYGSDGSVRKAVYLKAVPRLVRLRRIVQPDVCHAHYASSYGVVSALAGLRPLVVSIWGADVYTTASRSMLHRRIVSYVLRKADAVLSTSETMRRRGLELADVRISVVPFGVDTSRFAPRSTTSESGVLTVGAVKSLESKYGIDELLSAFALVKRRAGDTRLRLLIAGGGSQREELGRLAMSLGIEGETHFLGSVPNARVHEIHQELDIGVYPSTDESESFGVSVVESQSCGVAVIVTRVGGLPEVVREGVTAMVVEKRNTEELASAILQLIRDPLLRRKMGTAGREHIIERYDLNQSVARLESIYSTLSGLSPTPESP